MKPKKTRAESIAVLSDSRYQRLLDDVEGLLASGRAKVERATVPILADTYWRIGKRIDKEAMSERAQYATFVVNRLANDLAIHPRTLHHALGFFRRYPKVPRSTVLKWAHFRELLRIRDADERRFYEALVEEQGLSRDALVKAIGAGAYEAAASGTKEPTTGRHGRKRNRARPKEPTFVYEAYPYRVVDGDTLVLDIDLGFEVVIRRRVRLAAVDAPPLKETGGRAALRFVQEELARAEEVVVKTYRADLHGRYVVDLFYATKPTARVDVFLKGRHLNERLVDKGFAERVAGP